jgi:hypothetical protein
VNRIVFGGVQAAAFNPDNTDRVVLRPLSA